MVTSYVDGIDEQWLHQDDVNTEGLDQPPTTTMDVGKPSNCCCIEGAVVEFWVVVKENIFLVSFKMCFDTEKHNIVERIKMSYHTAAKFC